MDRTIEIAWQHKDILYLAMPSSRGGLYLVKVAPAAEGIEITHSCPAKGQCWHQKAALEAYTKYRWWEPEPEKVTFKNKVVLLDPHWEQIPVPGEIPPELEKYMEAVLNEHIA